MRFRAALSVLPILAGAVAGQGFVEDYDRLAPQYKDVLEFGAAPVVIENFLTAEECEKVLSLSYDRAGVPLVEAPSVEEAGGFVARGFIPPGALYPQSVLDKFAAAEIPAFLAEREMPVRKAKGNTSPHRDHNPDDANCPGGFCASLLIYLNTNSGTNTVHHGVDGKMSTEVDSKQGTLVIMAPGSLHSGTGSGDRYLLGPANPFPAVTLPESTRRVLIELCSDDTKNVMDAVMPAVYESETVRVIRDSSWMVFESASLSEKSYVDMVSSYVSAIWMARDAGIAPVEPVCVSECVDNLKYIPRAAPYIPAFDQLYDDTAINLCDALSTEGFYL